MAEAQRRGPGLFLAKGDAGFAEVVGGHLDFDLVAHADADEVFAHLAGNMGEDFMAVGKGHAKHGARQHLGHGSGQFDGFFFCHANAARI